MVFPLFECFLSVVQPFPELFHALLHGFQRLYAVFYFGQFFHQRTMQTLSE
jgi:hypothetical protein